MRLRPTLLCLAWLLQACPSPSEGTQPGDCDDGADNDADGQFDCDDDDCAGAPACSGDIDSDAPVDVDTEADTEADTETDSEGDTEADTEADTESDVIPPTQPTAAIIPADPDTLSLLEAVVTNPSVSTDGSPVSYTYEWFRNGETTSFQLATLASTHTTKGEAWTARVTPMASGVAGPSAEVTTTIVNAPPQVDSAQIIPAVLTATDSATCVGSGFHDPDGDADRSTVSWTVDGTPANEGPNLAASLSRGQVVSCAVQSNDGEDDGNRATTQVVVSNSPPSATGISIWPEYPLQNDELSCSGEMVDADGDSDQGTYRWLVDGIAMGTGPLLTGPHVVGSTVTCEYTPADGIDTGAALSTEVAIWPCGANASSVGSNACACDGQYEWCSDNTSSELYFDCCAYWTDTFDVVFESAVVHPVKADGQPWDWDGSVPAWLVSLVSALHEVDDLVGFCDSQPSLPAATVPGAAIFIACNSDTIVDTVDEYGPQILEGTTPPDPQLWAYFDIGNQSEDWFSYDHPDNTYYPQWFAGGPMFLAPNETVRFDVWDDDLASDDLIGSVVLDLTALQILAGRGPVDVQAGQLDWATVTVEPMAPAP